MKLTKTQTECVEILKTVFSDNAMPRALVFVWQERFSESPEEVEDDESLGRPEKTSLSSETTTGTTFAVT